MITIGIRANPKQIIFALYDKEEDEMINVEAIKIPVALEVPEGLKYARNMILDVLREYKVERGGLRVTEAVAQTPNIQRLQIEAVIQEAFASSSLEKYYLGQISNISSRIGIDRADFKLLIDGIQTYKPVKDWKSFSKEEREAILTALGAANA